MKQRVIWKWSLALMDKQTLNMPVGAKVLTVQMQGGAPQVWAYVDPTERQEPRTFSVIGTGNSFDDHPGDYVGTVQDLGGALIWHIFEKR